jgi:hypothetical protein
MFKDGIFTDPFNCSEIYQPQNNQNNNHDTNNNNNHNHLNSLAKKQPKS